MQKGYVSSLVLLAIAIVCLLGCAVCLQLQGDQPHAINISKLAAASIPNSASSSQSGGIALGAGIMIQQGRRFCDELQQYGSRVNWITLSWQRIQPGRGQWVYGQFDRWVDGYRSCGQEVFVHILSDAGWATEPIPPEIKRDGFHNPSMPARNSLDYYNFIYNVAAHYKGKITRYSIENEAHAQSNWGGTPEQYMQELQTAYRAIKAADPGAIVEDAAMSHEGLGYLTANYLYTQGRTREAIDFANSYAAHFYHRKQPPHIENAAQLARILGHPGVQATVMWENLLFQNHRYYDHMQIHNGAPWYDLQIVLNYLHDNLKAQNDDKPIDLWESWYSWTGAPGNGFDPQTQAREYIKFIATALGGGVDRCIYWLFNDYAIRYGQPGLVDNQGNPRPAAVSFKLASDKLTGARNVQKLDLGENIYGYRFTRNGKDVFVLWSASPATVHLPVSASFVKATDIEGKTTSVNPDRIPVSNSPIFVE